MNALLRGGALLTFAFAIEIGVQLVRTFVLARLLTPDEFGIAVAISLLFGIVEVAAFGGCERFLTYAPHGGTRRTIAAMHTVWFARGLLASFGCLLLAWPFAASIGHPELWSSFAMIGLASFCRGFAHLRTIQALRHNLVWPHAVVVIGASLVSVIAAVAATVILADHRAVIVALVGYTAGYALISQMLAGSCRWQLRFDRPIIGEAMRYSLPLAANGIALQALGQFDRIIVGAMLGVVVLASYSLAIMLLIMPTTLISSVVVSLLQPRLAKAWHDPGAAFPIMFGRVNWALVWLAATGAVMAAGFGDLVLAIVFGQVYRVGDATFALFGVAFFFRIARVSLNLGGLAVGQTMALVYANVFGALVMPCVALALWWHPSMIVAAGGFVLAEFFAFVASAVLMRKALRHSSHGAMLPWLAVATIPIAWGLAIAFIHPDWPWRALAVLVVAILSTLTAWRIVRSMRPAATT